MERKIGEVFDFLGVKLRVAEAVTGCKNCYFESPMGCKKNYDSTVGLCIDLFREDHKNIIFKKVK